MGKQLCLEMSTMKTAYSKINHPPKKRGYTFWLFSLFVIIGVGWLFYYGYCWGLWGRNSLLFQYLFQCSCPVASEETRYPDNVDVVVPACSYGGSILSPSGRLLYVSEQDSKFSLTYLLDFQTGVKTPLVLPKGSNYFLTDDLIFHSFYGDDEYILDIKTGNKYPIQNATRLKPNIYSMGDIEPTLLLGALLRVDQIFLIDDVFQPVIALSSDFRTHPDENFTFNVLDFPGDRPNRIEQFLQENQIDYHTVPDRFQEEALSPDGRFIARKDGIYLAGSGKKIVEAYTVFGIIGDYFSVLGWTYDSSGVIYYKFLDGCLFSLSSEYYCTIPVPQPLLKLKVPEEYLSPTLTP